MSDSAHEVAEEAGSRPMLLVNGVLNGGFEWISDATTDPRMFDA